MVMKKVTVTVDEYLYEFYKKIGENAGGIKPEKVMADALFKLAGELSLNAVKKDYSSRQEKIARIHDLVYQKPGLKPN